MIDGREGLSLIHIYSLRLDAEMWMRDHIAEAFDIVPYGYLDGAEE